MRKAADPALNGQKVDGLTRTSGAPDVPWAVTSQAPTLVSVGFDQTS